MTAASTKIKLKMTPMVRWMLSFNKEVETFPKVFNSTLIKELAPRYHAAEDRSRHLAQTQVKTDLLLLLALYAPALKGEKIFGQDISNLSFLAELLLVASAICFSVLVWNFTTARAYEWMVQSICDRHVDDPSWNGKYFAAANLHQELALHVASQKLHIDADQSERWSSGKQMAALEKMSTRLIGLAMWPLLFLHLAVTAWAIVALPLRAAVGLPIDAIIAVFAVVVNVYAMIFARRIHFKEQEFEAEPLRSLPVAGK